MSVPGDVLFACQNGSITGILNVSSWHCFQDTNFLNLGRVLCLQYITSVLPVVLVITGHELLAYVRWFW